MERFDLARGLVLRAGEVLGRERPGEGAVSLKADHQDLVTRCDRETELFLRRGILEAFPRDAIVGEELPRGAGGSGYVWYLDPIDGTTNFVNQGRNFAVSVGCCREGSPAFSLVLDVAAGELYSARAGEGARCGARRLRTSGRSEPSQMLLTTSGVLHTFLRDHPRRDALVRLAGEVRGVRCLGSVALELCEVAAGRADLFVAMRSSPWDHNAARLIVTEAGGAICALDGGPLPTDRPSPVLACATQAGLDEIFASYFA